MLWLLIGLAGGAVLGAKFKPQVDSGLTYLGEKWNDVFKA